MDQSAEITLSQWTAPKSPFTIEYSTRVVDDIRLAVMDAFHALQRGGVEIGGLLLGKFENGRVTILESLPIECQHAFGPSFTLSKSDLAALESLLASRKSEEPRVVGWYHSHTRSHIYLSDADLEIHRRFFPESWQVAMVLKPHPFEPVRAGFFFYEADGSIHASASYREFPIESQTVRQIPRPPSQTQAPSGPTRRPLFPGAVVDVAPVIDVSAEPAELAPATEVAPVIEPAPVAERARIVEPAPAAEPEPVVPLFAPIAAAPEPEPPAPVEPAPTRRQAEVQPPGFLVAPAPSRRWIGLVAVFLGLAIGAAGYQTRERWLPRLRQIGQSAAAVAPPPAAAKSEPPAAVSLGLAATDAAGQLQIRWNREAPELRKASAALLVITDDGETPQAIGLDTEHLLSGTFTYARRSGHVDVRLTIHHAEGNSIDEVATFLGAPPPATAAQQEESPGARKTRQDEAARLSKELEKQAARTRELEKTVEDMRRQIEQQQRQRLAKQSPESIKK